VKVALKLLKDLKHLADVWRLLTDVFKGLRNKWMEKRHILAIYSFKKIKEEDLGNYRIVSLMPVPRKPAKQIHPNVVSGHMQKRKVFGNCQLGLTKGKQCLTTLIAFYN